MMVEKAEKKGKMPEDSVEVDQLRGRLKRAGRDQDLADKAKKLDKIVKVSAGEVGSLADLIFNSTRDKIREVTIVDRFQGRLLPQLDIMAITWKSCIEIAAFRKDFKQFALDHDYVEPLETNLIDEFIYRTAQWQKSIAGKSLDRALDLTLAEIEGGKNDNDYYGEQPGISEK